MVDINTQLPSENEAAVAAQHGGPVAVPGHQEEHVVMTMTAFREMMGVGTEEAFEKSVAELRLSLAQAAAGKFITVEEARQKLMTKHGASSPNN
jgi:hypothetical protein